MKRYRSKTETEFNDASTQPPHTEVEYVDQSAAEEEDYQLTTSNDKISEAVLIDALNKRPKRRQKKRQTQLRKCPTTKTALKLMQHEGGLARLINTYSAKELRPFYTCGNVSQS